MLDQLSDIENMSLVFSFEHNLHETDQIILKNKLDLNKTLIYETFYVCI